MYAKRLLSRAPWFILAVALAGCGGGPGPTATAPGIVVDDQHATLRLEGQWFQIQISGAHGGGCAWAPFWDNPPDGSLDPARYATASTRPTLPQAGMYEVYAWWCDLPVKDLATQQRIWLCASGGYSCVPIYVNPRENAGQWNSLGTYYLEPDADVTVRNGATALGAPPGFETIADGAVVIDAFRFVYRGPRPASLTPVPFQPAPSPTPTK